MHINVTRVCITLIWLKSVTPRHEVMLLLTSNHKEVPYTHLIDPRGIQGWVCHGVTIWFQHLWTATSGSKTVDPLPPRKINFKGKTKTKSFKSCFYWLLVLTSSSPLWVCHVEAEVRNACHFLFRKKKKHLWLQFKRVKSLKLQKFTYITNLTNLQTYFLENACNNRNSFLSDLPPSSVLD